MCHSPSWMPQNTSDDTSSLIQLPLVNTPIPPSFKPRTQNAFEIPSPIQVIDIDIIENAISPPKKLKIYASMKHIYYQTMSVFVWIFQCRSLQWNWYESQSCVDYLGRLQGEVGVKARLQRNYINPKPPRDLVLFMPWIVDNYTFRQW